MKYILVTLAHLMLISSFAASGLTTVQANSEFPWVVTLHASVAANPYWGPYGGYHDIWYAIKAEFAKIGINLEINFYDDFTWWDRVWGWGWEKTWEEGGWDLTCLEWWMMPSGLIWLEPLVYSWMLPPDGYNIFPYMNTESDKLLWRGMHNFDAADRKHYLWKWQEELMRNPPMINLYYPRLNEVVPDWVEGWDPVVRFRDVSHLAVNISAMPPERQSFDSDQIHYAVSEEVWGMNPLFICTSTEQWMGDLQFETLYDLSIDPWPPTGQEPQPWEYYPKPALAAAPPFFMDGPNGPNTRARVPLRQGVKWSDYDTTCEIFDSEDVQFTFDVILNLSTKAVAHGDIASVIESVEIVNETCVDFILYEPYVDLATLLSNDKGLNILPRHILWEGEVKPCEIITLPSNWDFINSSAWLPVTGPFKLKEFLPDLYVLLERNPLYFGFDESVVGSPAWGPDSSVQAIFLKWVWDPASRIQGFQTYTLDLGYYPSAPMEVRKEIAEDPHLRVWQYDSPSSNVIMLNFNHSILSNRYVRQALAHAIPYEKILAEILPGWGIEGYPGKTLITPLHYFTDLDNVTVSLFNEELEPYQYDLEKALKCMEKWWYSSNQPYENGPLGDSDLNGLVDLDDWYIWRANIESDPSITWPKEVNPGYIIDPDFNNDNDVETLNDLPLWAANYGKEYL